MKKPFSERITALRKIVKENKERWDSIVSTSEEFQIECPLKMAKQTFIESEEQMDKLYKDILKKGGEGLMIKDPDSLYEDKDRTICSKLNQNLMKKQKSLILNLEMERIKEYLEVLSVLH